MKAWILFWVLLQLAYVSDAQRIWPDGEALMPEEPTTGFMSYTSRESAQADDYAASPYYKALDGAVEFTVPFAWADKQVFLHVGSSDLGTTVAVNGQPVWAEDRQSPAEFDITGYVKEGRNTLTVSGGAAKDLYIKALPKVRVRDFDIHTNLTDGYRNGVLDFGVIVRSHFLNEKNARVHFELFSPSGELLKSESKDVALRMRQEETVHFEAMILDVMSWKSDTPNLYTVMIRMQYGGRYVEYIQWPVAFRSIELADGKWLINGAPAQPAATYVASEANMDFSDYGYAAADFGREGFDFQPGTGPGNEPSYTETLLNRVKGNYLRTRNDPSVVAFSLGDYPENGYNFYEAYLWMKAHEKTRPVVFRSAGREWNTDVVENLNF